MFATAPPDTASADRRRWMGVLAKADRAALETLWAGLPEQPPYRFLRRPELGLVMVRGRAGGTGQRFNLGEMTMARCAVEMDDGTAGFGYVAGRDLRHAELAAVFDALLQHPGRRPLLEETVVAPLEQAQAERRRARAAKAAATRVDFFTMVRGD